MTDWDAEDFDPDAGFQQPSVVGDKWDGEDEDDVKDAWDDEDEEATEGKENENKEAGDSESAKAFQVKKKKKTNLEEALRKKEEKRKEKLEQLKKEGESTKELSPEEQLAENLRQEQLQKDAELELTKEMFDVTTLAEDSLDALNPTTKEQFDRFARLLKAKLETLESSPFYVDFLEDVMKDCCINLDTDYVKRIGNSVTAIATEKAKAQKAAVKGKKKNKKGVLVGSTKAGKMDELDSYNDLEDFI
ncbi:putative eukaryotic translation initiation factor 3 subunit J [Apostichopus japonicus]|uniref:Eukaryotic translation initiation factor 3 subunit J n=1 Tax=Stichopus japonicus TaxID=307972 RepID=A0A2G8LM01_STIJA|nr:putative eukaryotic translation initiation factor 3 subunit J [Apostichopus japonicus]